MSRPTMMMAVARQRAAWRWRDTWQLGAAALDLELVDARGTEPIPYRG